jgi:diguanylate cyclase (GGDEF)-like protein/PAS domain S-box-containing protein
LCTHDRQGLAGFEGGELAVLEATAGILGQALHGRELGEALRASERRWRSLVQNASDLVLVVDADAVITYASPAATRVLSDGVALVGTRLLDHLLCADPAAARQKVSGIAATTGTSARIDLRFRCADGYTIEVEAVVSNLLDDAAVGGIVLNCRDVTERAQAERLQAGQARVLENIASGAPLADTLHVLAATAEEQIEGARCLVHVGALHDARLVVAPNLTRVASAAAIALVADLFAADASSSGGPAWSSPEVRRVVLTEPDVEVRTVTAATFGAPHDDQTFGVIALCGGDDRTFDDAARIVTNAARLAGIAVEHAGVQDRLAHQAEHDPVTDLPNRVVFLNRLIHALPVAERMRAYVLVLFLDLDRFKEVNDSFGHSAGDDLLRQVAQRLRHAVRPGDIVARFGGDEFTMLCDGITDELHAVEVAERIQTVLTRPFTVDGREIYVTTSIGLALDRGSHRRPETVVENADAAMYRAKDRGGNCYEIFDEAMRARAVRRLATQTALHGAIARREFHVFYQTTVSLDTGDVVGVEALVRWTRPGTGLLMPADFIPLAEETGLIVPIGAHVMEEAFRQATRWGVGGRTPTTSVNLSARQLAHPGCCPWWRRRSSAAAPIPRRSASRSPRVP